MARLLPLPVVVTLLAGLAVGAAWSADLPASGDPRTPSTDDRHTQAVRGAERELYTGDPTGARFVAAEFGRVRPVAASRDVRRAVEAVVPGDSSHATPPRDAIARSVWDRLADCESGDWRHGTPQPGTARWDYGLNYSHGDIYEGGVNFHPRTWDAYRDRAMPGHAGHATRGQQIAVAERVLAAQGWGAWPVCSRMQGLR